MLDDLVEILLVEDSPTDAELTISALKERNLANKLVWLQDGAAALDFLFATGAYAHRDMHKPPKVVLLDLRMPKVDGYDVLRRLKADERTRDIPVVVLTSSKEERDVDICYRLGVNSFVSKPVGFDAFAKTVSDLGFYWLLVNHPPTHTEV